MNNTNSNSLMNVITNDGKSYQIYVIETFEIDQYLGKKYIAYTFGQKEENMTKSYISVINMDGSCIKLEAITDKEELNIVQESLKMLLSEKMDGDI